MPADPRRNRPSRPRRPRSRPLLVAAALCASVLALAPGAVEAQEREKKVNIDPLSLKINDIGEVGTYEVWLNAPPDQGETVTVNTGVGTSPEVLTVDPKSLEFTNADWNVRQTVTVQSAIRRVLTTPQRVEVGHTELGTYTVGDRLDDDVIVTIETAPKPDRVEDLMLSSVPERGDQLTATWSSADRATGYKVQWKSGTEIYDPGARQATVSSGTSHTITHTITELTGLTEYDVQVIATNGPERLFHDADASEKSQTTSLGKVTNLMDGGTHEMPSVSWDLPGAPSDVQYRVRWKRNEDTSYNDITGTIETGDNPYPFPQSQGVIRIEPGLAYTIRVVGFQGSKFGIPSDEEVFTWFRLESVGPVGIPEVFGGYLKLTWPNRPSDADGYEVQWKRSGSMTWRGEDKLTYTVSEVETGSAGGTVSIGYDDLTPGTEYALRVRVKQGAENGPWSDPVMGTPGPSPMLTQVMDVKVKSLSASGLDVEWDAVDDATGYKVQWRTGDENWDPMNRQASVRTGTSHNITGLDKGTTYAVRVIATRNFAPEGAPSDEKTGFTFGDPGVRLLSASGEAITELTVREGDTVEYMVVLGAPDTGDVTVTLDRALRQNCPNCGVDAIELELRDASGATLMQNDMFTFTTSNWHEPQTVTVTGVENDTEDPDGRQVDIQHDLSATNNYIGMVGSMPNPTLAVTVLDKPKGTPGVAISEAALTVSEPEQTATYTVALTGPPEGAVNVNPMSADPTVARVSPNSLRFWESNWRTPQTVTVTAVNDDAANPDGQRTTTITHQVEGYGDVTADPVQVTVSDDDGGGSGPGTGTDPDPEPGTELGQVTGVTVTPVPEGLEISWNAADNAERYKVRWRSVAGSGGSSGSGGSTDSDGGYDGELITTELSVVIPDLDPDTEYAVQVTALRGDEEGPTSDEVMGTPLPEPPVITVTAAEESVTEGPSALAVFTLTADAEPASDLTVVVEVGQTGGYLAADDTGRREVMLPAGELEATVEVTIEDDTVEEEDSGTVTLTLQPGDGYEVAESPADTASVTVEDDDRPRREEQERQERQRRQERRQTGLQRGMSEVATIVGWDTAMTIRDRSLGVQDGGAQMSAANLLQPFASRLTGGMSPMGGGAMGAMNPAMGVGMAPGMAGMAGAGGAMHPMGGGAMGAAGMGGMGGGAMGMSPMGGMGSMGAGMAPMAGPAAQPTSLFSGNTEFEMVLNGRSANPAPAPANPAALATASPSLAHTNPASVVSAQGYSAATMPANAAPLANATPASAHVSAAPRAFAGNRSARQEPAALMNTTPASANASVHPASARANPPLATANAASAHASATPRTFAEGRSARQEPSAAGQSPLAHANPPLANAPANTSPLAFENGRPVEAVPGSAAGHAAFAPANSASVHASANRALAHADPSALVAAQGRSAVAASAHAATLANTNPASAPANPSALAFENGSALQPAPSASPSGPLFRAWGRGAQIGYNNEALAGRRHDGDIRTILAGVDATWNSGLVFGVAAGWHQADVDFNDTTVAATGNMNVSMWSVNPYASFQNAAGVRVWGAAGVGQGTLDYAESGHLTSSGLGMTTGAGGIEYEIASSGIFDVIGRTEGMFVNLDVDASSHPMVGYAAFGSRAFGGRGELEMGAPVRSDTVLVRPYWQVAYRWDGGDAELGSSVEYGGGVAIKGSTVFLDAAVRSLTNTSGSFESLGYSLAAGYDGGADKRGLSLRFEQSAGPTRYNPYGGGSGLPTTFLPTHAAGQSYRARGGYGLDFGSGLLTPYMSADWGGYSGRSRLDWGAAWERFGVSIGGSYSLTTVGAFGTLYGGAFGNPFGGLAGAASRTGGADHAVQAQAQIAF